MEITRKNLSCDVLIVGGGIGGLCCAAELVDHNSDLNVMIIEKNFTGYGGKANKGGGVLQYFRDELIEDPVKFLGFHVNEIGCYLQDQDLMAKYVVMNHEMMDKMVKWGINIPTKEDGSYDVMPTGPFTAMISIDLDLCLQVRKYVEKRGVKIMDKTAMTSVYAEDGRVAGACAFSILDDGTFYTIAAKKVVLATGSQNYRVGSMWSSGRGDGISAAYRAGAEMRNPEFGNFSQLVKARSHHEVVFGENFMYNAKNEFITANFTDKRQTDIPSVAVKEWYLQMKNGTGPVHLDFGPAKRDEKAKNMLWKLDYGQRFHDLNHADGADIDVDMEVVPILIGEQSCVKVGHDMQTTIKGLYAIGDTSYCGSGAPGAVPAPPGRNRGSGILNAVFSGILAGDALAVADYDAAPVIKDAAVEAEFEALYAPLYRTEGYEAREVYAEVQKAMAPAEYSVYMHADRIAEAEKHVAKAAEMVKNVKAVDMHGVLNAHEAEYAVLSAQLHYFAAKERKESRGWFLREEYPEMDNENWLKWIIVKNVDGKMEMSFEPVPIEKFPIQIPKH